MSTRERERSVQFYVPASTHQALRIKSAVEDRTLGEILRGLIDRALSTEPARQEPGQRRA